MKQHARFLFFAILIFLGSCAHLPKGDKTIVKNQQTLTSQTATATFIVDTTATFIRFTGHGVGQNHPGRFHLADGKISVANNLVTGGQFTINIASLQIEQPEEIYQTKLKRHLLSNDFFDTAKWRTATFAITEAKPFTFKRNDTSVVPGANYAISGNLTLKGITKNITFPAKITMVDDTLTARANFNLDRTKWGMYYGSDKSLGDKFISEQVNVQLNVKAMR